MLHAGESCARAFTGLLLCGECGYTLIYNNSRYSNGLRCMSHYNISATRPDCTQNKWIHEDKIRDWLTPLLEQLIKTRDWSSLDGTTAAGHDTQAEIDAIQTEINQVNAQIIRMIDDQSRQDNPAVTEIYENKIRAAGDRLDILHNRLESLSLQSATNQHTVRQRQYSIDELARVSVEYLWGLPGDEINQLLHRLMGNRRIEILDGQIVATRNAPPSRRRPKSK